MKHSITLAIALLATGCKALPDYSHLVPGASPAPPPDGDFKFGPFFLMYSGTPPTATSAPLYPPPPAPAMGSYEYPSASPFSHPTNPPQMTYQPTVSPPVSHPTNPPQMTQPTVTAPVSPATNPPQMTQPPATPPVSPSTNPPVMGPQPTALPAMTQPPVALPVPPSTNPPVMAPQPTALPVMGPTNPPANTLQPSFSLRVDTQPPQQPVPSNSRTASYQYQWGGVSDGCRFNAPRSLLRCLEGGLLIFHDLTNADCSSLASDVVLCSQIDPESDATVDFECMGNTVWHITANARTLATEATGCNSVQTPGGSAAAAATLGRLCNVTDTGAGSWKFDFSCAEGQGGVMDGTQFCGSLGQCSQADCNAFIAPIDMTAIEENPTCSSPELSRDLSGFTFIKSSLASFNAITWTFSDIGFNCDWTVPDIEISCRNGGVPQLVNNVEFCHVPSGSQVIVCTNPDPSSADGRIVIELEFWCLGTVPEQLVLDARTLDADTSGATCEPGGLMVQGLDISRGCGEFDTEAFTLFKSPSFCADPAQFHNDICFSGFACPGEGPGCTGGAGSNMTLPSVRIDTADPVVQSCIYAEQDLS